MIRVLLADDQANIRSAFRIIVDTQPDMTVVGETADGTSTLSLARRLRPDVILADVRMPGMDGLEVTRRLAGPEVEDPLRVVVVTTFDLDEYAHTALRNGATGFLLKRSSPALLIESIRAAMAGDTLISPQLTVRLLRHLTRPTASPAGETVSPREREIIALVGSGATNQEIADELFLAAGTVKNHLYNIQRKLGVRNRVAIAAWSWENLASRPAPRSR